MATEPPGSGGRSPAITLKSVDLPQPLGPTIVRNSPSGPRRSTGRRTGRRWPSPSKVFETRSSVSLSATVTCLRRTLLLADHLHPGRHLVPEPQRVDLVQHRRLLELLVVQQELRGELRPL